MDCTHRKLLAMIIKYFNFNTYTNIITIVNTIHSLRTCHNKYDRKSQGMQI